MHVRDMREWRPFSVESGRVTLSPPAVWREPETWQRAALRAVVGIHKQDVLVVPDLFAEYDRRIYHCQGAILHRSTEGRVCLHDFNEQRAVTFADVLRDIFALIDRTPLLTFWLPTRHPERVRERWPEREEQDQYTDGKWARSVSVRPVRLANVRLGVPEGGWETQQHWFEALFRCGTLAHLCGGVFVLGESGDVEVVE